MEKKHRTIISITFTTLLIHLGLDRVTKWLAVTYLQGQDSITLFNGFILIQYAENTGGFLSFGANWPLFLKYGILLVFPLIICLSALIYCLIRETRPGRAIIISTIVGGGFGNLFDRMFQGFMVIDFLNFGIGPIRTGILNVADLSITFGAFALLWYELKRKRSASSLNNTQTSVDRGSSQAMDTEDCQ